MPSLPRVDRLKTIYSAAKGINDGYVVYGVPEASRAARFTPAPHRITLRFDPISVSSAGARSYISSALCATASSLPSVAFYTQPVRQQKALLTAEYAHGKQIRVVVDGASEEEVGRYMAHVVSRAGDPIKKMTVRQSSDVPSIQGEWTPSFHDAHSSSHTPPATKYFMERKAKEGGTAQ